MLVAKRKQAGKYSWHRMAEQTLDIYKQALGEWLELTAGTKPQRMPTNKETRTQHWYHQQR